MTDREALVHLLLTATVDEVADRLDELERAGVPGDVCHALVVLTMVTRDIVGWFVRQADPGTEDAVLAEQVEKLLGPYRIMTE